MCIFFFFFFATTSLGDARDHARACVRMCRFACAAVRMRGRCEGFPSVWNEVLYSRWDAIKRDGKKKSSWGGVGAGGGLDLNRC